MSSLPRCLKCVQYSNEENSQEQPVTVLRLKTVPDRSCLGYVVPQWSAYRLPAFAIAMQHKSLPLFVSMHRWAWDVMSRKALFCV